MTTSVEAKAVVGRRVEFTFYRDQTTRHPGIITALTDTPAGVGIRLDGERYTLRVRPDYEGLRYLDQVTPVPDLPMGRFRPTVRDFGGFEYDDVPVCELNDESIVVLTGDPKGARTAATAFCADMGLDLEFVGLEQLDARWAVFEWQPEDAECQWTVRVDATEGDDQAVRIHYLPA
jgi:hypothetical protein